MAVYGDPRQGEAGRILADDDARPLATFTARPTPERPWADAFRPVPGADLTLLADVAVQDLPGVRLRTDPATAEALVAAGASVVRHTHRMRRDLETDPPPVEWAAPSLPSGLTITAVDRPGTDLAPAAVAAHGDPAAAGAVIAAVEGSSIGPLVPDPSALVVDADGRVVAGILVLSRPLGPLVDQLFRHPDLAGSGVGTALLRRALVVCSLTGDEHLALLVPEGNPAIPLYRRLGFVETAVDVTVDLPGTHPAWRQPGS